MIQTLFQFYTSLQYSLFFVQSVWGKTKQLYIVNIILLEIQVNIYTLVLLTVQCNRAIFVNIFM